MFTGLIQSGAFVKSFKDFETFRQLLISFPKSAWEKMSPSIGSSIAINGVCLTVVQISTHSDEVWAAFDVSPETLGLTNLLQLHDGAKVHFEASLRVGQELGGHWVLGHVDGMGTLKEWKILGEGVEMIVAIEGDFRKKMAPLVVDKGSIAVDGVSLTINRILDNSSEILLSFFLIPHTLRETRFETLKTGDRLNLELDVVGKYILRAQALKEISL